MLKFNEICGLADHSFLILHTAWLTDRQMHPIPRQYCLQSYYSQMCQSSIHECYDIWYFPNGTRVPSSGIQWDLHRTRGQMVVLLHRRRGGENGIYRCAIPDATNVIQNIYIGVYTGSPGECPLDQGVLYSICRDGPVLKSHWVLHSPLIISRELELASTVMSPARSATEHMYFAKSVALVQFLLL